MAYLRNGEKSLNNTIIGPSQIISLLASIDIDPIDYMTYVPERYYSNTSLETITLPPKITSIEEFAFAESSCLRRVNIPNSVTNIQNYAFRNCKRLVEVSLPKALLELGEQVFEGTALKSIIIPSQLKTLEKHVFIGARSLEKVKIEGGVEIIKESCFMFCDALTDIELPKSINRIEFNAFSHCPKLEQITFKGISSDWRAITKERGWANNTLKYIKCDDKTLKRNVK